VNRRDFVALATAVRLDQIPVRKAGRVEIVFKSPATKSNGLQATKDGLWIIDQGPRNQAHLVDYKDGKVVKGFETETESSSGITYDGEALWIGSTYSREIVKCDANAGKAIERRFTPGAGVIYKIAGDPPQRSSPVPENMRQVTPARPPRPDAPKRVGGFLMVQVSSRAPGTGAIVEKIQPADNDPLPHGMTIWDGWMWYCDDVGIVCKFKL
jgi:hypothetical protein